MVLVSPLFGAILLLPGCLTLIETVWLPSEVMVEEVFTIAVDGSVTGHGGGMAGMVVQVPLSFEFEGAVYVTASARRVLRRSPSVAARYEAEPGHHIYALIDSIQYSRETHAEVRVLLRFRPRETGTYTVKFATGVAVEQDGRLSWVRTDPSDVREFARLEDAARVRSLRVIHPERNGTGAVALEGKRQYLLFPKSSATQVDLARDFSIEMWCRTAETDFPLLSTRGDDFVTAFPFEMQVSERGELEILCADGREVHRSDASAFIADGIWHHLAVSFCKDSMRYLLCLDGRAVDTLSLPEGMRGLAAGDLVLGSNVSRTRFARAEIEELRFWEACRSEQEVSYYKDLALSGYEPSLAALFSFDAGSEGRIPGNAQGDSLALLAFNRPRLVVSTAPLRIELLAFAAEMEDDTVRMHWETFDESRVKLYEVEKRTESGKFSVHRVVEPLRAEDRHQEYMVTDTWSGRDVVYYRLRKVTTDGTVLFSEEVPIGLEAILNFVLEDNIPNPFTATTEIRYSLSRRTQVELTVYDMSGREIARLVNERQDPGAYSVTFDAEDIPGGMYFYKMRTSAGSQTKKMYLAR
ncbi:MAG: T9SS type A sorting domain-containing protein [Bacteroidetes bacterium]|nr:T9SS type A sorting domain-containing protein [Bacteroidota bacterium]